MADRYIAFTYKRIENLHVIFFEDLEMYGTKTTYIFNLFIVEKLFTS